MWSPLLVAKVKSYYIDTYWNTTSLVRFFYMKKRKKVLPFILLFPFDSSSLKNWAGDIVFIIQIKSQTCNDLQLPCCNIEVQYSTSHILYFLDYQRLVVNYILFACFEVLMIYKARTYDNQIRVLTCYFYGYPIIDIIEIKFKS